VWGVENGEISLWDTVDGQCLESKRMAQVHTIMQAYRYPTPHTLRGAVSLSPDLVYSSLFDRLLREVPVALISTDAGRKKEHSSRNKCLCPCV
jgi:hypothetical protein